MEDNTNNEGPDADLHQNVIGDDSLLDPQNLQSDLPIDENNNGLRRSPENTGYFNRPFETPSVTVGDLILLIIPLFAHEYDVINDIYLTIEYFMAQNIVYGCLTLAFVIFPTITCSWISSRMYGDDRQLEIQADGEDDSRNYLEKITELKANFAMVLLLQLALPLRYFRNLCYALRVRKCEQTGDNNGLIHYYPKMLKEREDLALLNVIEGFLESAPQLILQLTILLMENRATTTMWFKIVGGCVTLFTLGWSMKTYHCAIRLAQPDKTVVNILGQLLLFVWHFGTISTRIFLIAIAASNWLTYTLFARVLIWMGMTAWLYTEDGVFAFCQNRTVSPLTSPMLMDSIRSLLFAATLAVVYIFSFVNLNEGPTCRRYTIYHIWCGLENLTVIVLWVISPCIENVQFSRSLLIMSVILYAIGIGAMVMYYSICHPTLQNRLCMLSLVDFV